MKNYLLIVTFFVSIPPCLFGQWPINNYRSVGKVALEIPEPLTISTSSIASYVSANFALEKHLPEQTIQAKEDVLKDLPDAGNSLFPLEEL